MTQILMPALSPTMTQGNVVKWHKKAGDQIKSGDLIAEIETDKAIMDLESTEDGILEEILVPEGSQNIAVATVIGKLKTKDTGHPKADKKIEHPKENKAPALSQPVLIKNEKIDPLPISSTVNKEIKSDHIYATPLARKLAKDHNLNLSTLKGSGPNGRIIEEDINATLGKLKKNIINSSAENFDVVKNSNLRTIIADRLTTAKQSIPHFYMTIEIDMGKLIDLRTQINLQNQFEISNKVSINDLIIKATALAIEKYPTVNSSWHDDHIKIYQSIDISFAVAVQAGVITPVIRNAKEKNILAIAKETSYLIEKAKLSKLSPSEYQDGTFTISNMGMYKISSFSAIINPPQACILAIARTENKPVVRNSSICIAQIANITASCDHRIIDGVMAANFLTKLKEIIENPLQIIIGP